MSSNVDKMKTKKKIIFFGGDCHFSLRPIKGKISAHRATISPKLPSNWTRLWRCSHNAKLLHKDAPVILIQNY